jgi:hypothetical protein
MQVALSFYNTIFLRSIKQDSQNQHTLRLRQIGWEQHTPNKHNTQTKNGNHHDTELYGFLLNFNKIYEFYGS